MTVAVETEGLRVQPGERANPNATMEQAVAWLGISYSTLWRKAKGQRRFTTIQDEPGKGNPILIPWDELDVYKTGGLPALKKFRTRKGRK